MADDSASAKNVAYRHRREKLPIRFSFRNVRSWEAARRSLFAVQVLKVVPEPILLYSVNTWLAYAIAEQYYSGLHYVWCTPHFDPSGVPSINYAVPPSSSPVEVYRGLRQDVTNGDRHSAKISANKAGILRGVEARRTHGDITEGAAAEIVAILDAADIRDFRPILFVIPFSLVRDKIEPVPVSQRAHPLSAEFIIERLPRNCFDAIGVDGI